jgi:hypothetical protein
MCLCFSFSFQNPPKCIYLSHSPLPGQQHLLCFRLLNQRLKPALTGSGSSSICNTKIHRQIDLMPCTNPLAIFDHDIIVCKSSFADCDEERRCSLWQSRPHLTFPQKAHHNPGPCIDAGPLDCGDRFPLSIDPKSNASCDLLFNITIHCQADFPRQPPKALSAALFRIPDLDPHTLLLQCLEMTVVFLYKN